MICRKTGLDLLSVSISYVIGFVMCYALEEGCEKVYVKTSVIKQSGRTACRLKTYGGGFESKVAVNELKEHDTVR